MKLRKEKNESYELMRKRREVGLLIGDLVDS